MDNQQWANWFAVTIPWGTDLAMTGSYVIEQDFLFWVDPATSGLPDPNVMYDADCCNHRDTSGNRVYGLGEFFDAGSQSSDRQYRLNLLLSGGSKT